MPRRAAVSNLHSWEKSGGGCDNFGVATLSQRELLVRLGNRLEYFTIAYNSAEGLAAMAAGIAAGSVALVGFGLDSVIEVASGGTLLWRLRHDADVKRRDRAERTTLRAAGICLLALALYIAWESGWTLVRREVPSYSMLGIAVAAVSVVIMPILARAKRRVARGIGSGAMHVDSRQADFCAYLSAILLVGLVLNATLGWWWADPAAGLVMVPIIGREGLESLKGKKCGCE